MISPTVGRVVHYRHDAQDLDMARDVTQPMAAIVTHVWHDRMVNLVVFDASGAPFSRTSVTLVQEGDPVPSGRYCEWMSYQKGQAAKTEALEAQLKGAPQS